MAESLKVWTTEQDWVIAESAEEAQRLWAAVMGAQDDDGEAGDWEPCAPGDPFTFHYSDGSEETKTFAEWVAEHGRGYFASADF